jgi:hypothetical protein
LELTCPCVLAMHPSTMCAFLLQICPEFARSSDQKARRIAEFLGLEVIPAVSFPQALEIAQRFTQTAGVRVGIMVSASTLAQCGASAGTTIQAQLEALRDVGDWFVHGFDDGAHADAYWRQCLGTLSVPAASLEPAGLQCFRFEPPSNSNSPLSGLEFQCRDESPCHVFPQEMVTANINPLVILNGKPFLVSRARGRLHDYLLAESPSVDIDAPLVPPRVSRDYFAGLLPTAVALREMFGESCWHNPFPTGSVVVDDPLVRRQYGAFNYDEMTRDLREHAYAATVAFIPCNFRRSDPSLAAELAGQPERVSFCVHGCYHTKSEFGELDPHSIENTARTALRFMERHEEISGLPFERTMVFPQGVFSAAAMAGLRKCGYVAAVNSDPYPTDHAKAPVAIGDVFDLAIMRYSLFPLFTRRYPQEIFEFATDLFFGKPAIIVEHHEYFRTGFGPLSRFIGKVNGLAKGIAWLTLEKSVTRAGKYRVLGPDRFEVQFVTTEFRLGNPRGHECTFCCWKPELESAAVVGVTVDGLPWEFSREDRRLRLEISLNGGGFRIIRVQYAWPDAPIRPKPISYILGAKLRRRLSEFRDDYISEKSLIGRMVHSMRKTVGRLRNRSVGT